jgi:hypothetical protein
MDPSKISREKRRVGASSITERVQDILKLECIGLDSKKDANVPVVLQEQDGPERNVVFLLYVCAVITYIHAWIISDIYAILYDTCLSGLES